MSTAPIINQKEYLKKYLNIGSDKDKKKKKKKKVRTIQNGIKIIDDNIDVINSETLTQNELDEFLTQEDAPQVVGVLDDRPLALRLDDYRKNSKWKLVGSDDEEFKNVSHLSSKGLKSEKDLSPRRYKKSKYDSDESPPRKQRRDSDPSPPRRSYTRRSPDSDVSPPRRKISPDSSPRKKNKHNYDSDPSPPRKSKNMRSPGSDISPPRRNLSPKGDTNSAHRKRSSGLHNRHFSDTSPPRKPKNYGERANRSPLRNSDLSRQRKRNKPNYDSDTSPPRKNKYLEERSTQKKDLPYIKQSPDSSPSRRDNSVSDSSPPRKNKQINSPHRSQDYKRVERTKKSRWADASPEKINCDSDLSPPKTKSARENDKSHSKKYSSEPSTSKKMEKTLDGKTAGLQNAKDLKHETQSFKKREDELFKKMAEDVSGINAAPVIRDRKTGKKRDFEKEAIEEYAKLKRGQEQKEKYDKWGKGLKQVENWKEKIESDLHEMSKPLARYADDEDLERHLKEQERDGDPMLAYIRKKKKKQATAEGRPVKPVYEGEFMPNRFGIPPGHRWDGVDRSCGYEKQWFAKQNAKKAMEEEIYKWSTEDM